MRLLYIKCIICILLIAFFVPDSFAQNAKSPAAQRAIDEQLLQDYFTKHNIQPQKTAYGLYYTISKEGAGKNIMAGETVTIYYTGKLLDGTAFDSNTDPAFHHTEPLTFELGVGRVIRGWDKGIQLLKRGTVATLYIPSNLGYGPQDSGPIPANSILVFDIDVRNVSK